MLIIESLNFLHNIKAILASTAATTNCCKFSGLKHHPPRYYLTVLEVRRTKLFRWTNTKVLAGQCSRPLEAPRENPSPCFFYPLQLYFSAQGLFHHLQSQQHSIFKSLFLPPLSHCGLLLPKSPSASFL